LAKQFGEKIEQAFQAYGQLCIGIDPHEAILGAWNLDFDAEGLAEFSSRVLEACAGRVGIIKPQVSFFERFGSAGFAVLETLIREARARGILVIADAKRGDIGTTMDAYLGAWLQPGSPLESDALTVSPFLGAQTYLAGMNDYLPKGKGVVSLVSTSNPEGQMLQNAKVADATLSKQLWNELSQANQVTAAAGSSFGSFCAVIGATRPIAHLDLSEAGGVNDTYSCSRLWLSRRFAI